MPYLDGGKRQQGTGETPIWKHSVNSLGKGSYHREWHKWIQGHGIHSFKPSAIPEHVFLMSENTEKKDEDLSNDFHPIPSTSKAFSEYVEPLSVKDSRRSTEEYNKVNDSLRTNSQGKILHEISPIPKIPGVKRTKRKQSAAVLTSEANRSRKKLNLEKEALY